MQSDVLVACQEFHEHGQFEKNLNATFIVLIPKRLVQLKLKISGPISLVGGVYKIIAKDLANRLSMFFWQDHLHFPTHLCQG